MKSNLTLLAIAVISLSLFSCHKKDSDSSSSLKAKIIGTWDEQVAYTYLYTNGELIESDTSVVGIDDYAKIEFKSDGTVSLSTMEDGEEDHESGKYSLSGDKLTLIGVDPEDQAEDTAVIKCQINGSQMVWIEEATITSTSGDVNRFGYEMHFTRE